MPTRFDIQLEELGAQLISMGALCESAIANTAKGLLEFNPDMCRRAMELSGEIDRKESEIENLCLRLLLLQHPVAKDLRLISSALKMITDMERIGDQASDISELTLRHLSHKAISLVPVKEMASATIRMVTDSVESFVKRDLSLAKDVIKYDDIVDNLFNEMKTALILLIRSNSDMGEDAIDLLMVAKYFERIGDHAVNIADWVVFSITATHHNSLPR